MTQSEIILIVVIAVYLLGMLIVGILCSRDTKDVGDFYLGGRKLGPLVTAMSAESSDMSSYLLMGVPGLAYTTGIGEAGWTAIGLIIGTYLNWLFVSKRLRNYSVVANNSITLPDFFKNRYKDNSNILLIVSAIAIIVFFVPYTASGFAACGKLFNSLFGANYYAALIISAVVIVGYTSTGGFLAASHTDFIQSIIMIIALMAAVIFGVETAGGIDAVADNARNLAGLVDLTKLHDNTVAGGSGSMDFGFFSIVTTLAWGLGYFGMPHILLRFMAINDPNKLKLSRRVATVWVTISLSVAVFIGIVGRAMTEEGKLKNLIMKGDEANSSTTAETLIVKLAHLMSDKGIFLLIILGGIILAGILASTMSTADSQLIAASSAVSENIIHDVFKIELNERKQMIIARLTLIVISVIAVILALNPNSNVFTIVSFAWAGFGAVFGPVMLFSLFWKRTNKYGAIAGMISGGVMVFFWKFVIRPLGGVWNLYELAPAFLLACICIVVVSLLTPAPSEEIVAEFEEAKRISSNKTQEA